MAANEPPSTVWADEWNPPTDYYDPNADVDPWGENIGLHGDDPTAEPISESYGIADGAGTVADTRLNLLDSVRRGTQPAPLPVQEHHHVVETVEKGASRVRARVHRVSGNTTETVLLEQNDNRTRALIKIVTSTSVILIGPARQGGNPAFNAVPTGPAAFWYHATGDGTFEMKSSAAISAFGTSATGAVDVAVWEEIEGDTSMPGLY